MINERKAIARRQRRMVLQEKQQTVAPKQKQVRFRNKNNNLFNS